MALPCEAERRVEVVRPTDLENFKLHPQPPGRADRLQRASANVHLASTRMPWAGRSGNLAGGASCLRSWSLPHHDGTELQQVQSK